MTERVRTHTRPDTIRAELETLREGDHVVLQFSVDGSELSGTVRRDEKGMLLLGPVVLVDSDGPFYIGRWASLTITERPPAPWSGALVVVDREDLCWLWTGGDSYERMIAPGAPFESRWVEGTFGPCRPVVTDGGNLAGGRRQ